MTTYHHWKSRLPITISKQDSGSKTNTEAQAESIDIPSQCLGCGRSLNTDSATKARGIYSLYCLSGCQPRLIFLIPLKASYLYERDTILRRYGSEIIANEDPSLAQHRMGPMPNSRIISNPYFTFFKQARRSWEYLIGQIVGFRPTPQKLPWLPLNTVSGWYRNREQFSRLSSAGLLCLGRLRRSHIYVCEMVELIGRDCIWL